VYIKVLNVTPSAFSVSYATTNPAKGSIYYGSNPADLNAQVVSRNGLSNRHWIDIEGLNPGTIYYFKLCSNIVCDSQNPDDLYGLLDIRGDWISGNIVSGGFSFSVTTAR
jgi:hypothetical protein